MAEDDEGHDLWGDAWSHVARPEEDPLIPRELWSPSQRRANAWHPPDGRAHRKHAEIGGRDAHLTFEPPKEYRPRPESARPHGERRRQTHAGSATGPQTAPAADRAPARPPIRGRAATPEETAARLAAPPGRHRTAGPSSASARSLAPRGTVVGYRRGRGRARLLLAIGAVVLLAAAGLFAYWMLTRPAALALTPSPADATVTVQGRGARSGALLLEKLEPGELTAVVARDGYETATVTVQVGRGERVTRTVALVPKPFKLSFTSRPKGATVTVTRADGSKLTGATPCSLTTSAGPVTVSIAKAGSNTFTQSLFVESARAIDVLLDPKGQVVHALGSLTAKGAPKSVAVTPDGREAWAAILNGPPSIEIYDLKTMRKVGGIDIGKYGAVEVIFNRAGTFAYASQMETAKVFEIDTATRKVTRSFNTMSAWTKVVALSPDEKTLYAANWSGNDVSVISLLTGKLVKRVPVAKTPRGLWPTADGKYLFVAGFDAGDLERIDLATWGVKKVFHSGGAMRHLVADEKTGRLYASDMNKDVVWVTDMKTLKTAKFCNTDEKPNTIELSPDGKVLFISNRGENNPVSYYIKGYEWGTVLLMSTVDGHPLDAIVGGNQCTALDVSADGRTLVFSDFLDDRLRVYDVPAFSALSAGNGGRFAAHFADLKKAKPSL
jgi:YVTN family beta-propeller protein